jgi:ATP-dependent Lon protease
MSYARRTLKQELPKLHISFRDPSVSKDGASAGVAMYMSIMSCMLDKKLENCAFTGTIDAFGNVGMVGVDEKLSAAEREGIERVYIPQDNFEQMKENNRLDKYKVEIVPISHVNELNKEFFGLEVS